MSSGLLTSNSDHTRPGLHAKHHLRFLDSCSLTIKFSKLLFTCSKQVYDLSLEGRKAQQDWCYHFVTTAWENSVCNICQNRIGVIMLLLQPGKFVSKMYRIGVITLLGNYVSKMLPESIWQNILRPGLCGAYPACYSENRHLRWLPSWRLMSNTSANFRVVQMSSLAYPTGFWASPLPWRRPPTSRRGGQIFPTTLRIAEVLLVRRHDGSQRRCLIRMGH